MTDWEAQSSAELAKHLNGFEEFLDEIGYNPYPGLYNEIQRRLKLLGGLDTVHVLEVNDDGWALQHTLECRPNLIDCEMDHVIRNLNGEDGIYMTGKRVTNGRYIAKYNDWDATQVILTALP